MYTTQMQAARKGIITDEMKKVASKEEVTPGEIRELISEGKVAIPANKNHAALSPWGIGQGLRTKINVNLGISADCSDYSNELEKLELAMKMKAEAVMDLSCHGKTREFRRKVIEVSTAAVGTVPVYDAMGYYGRELSEISADEFLEVVERHAQDGVDFMTIHAGINRETALRFRKNRRLTNIVSRGGALMFSWMEATGNENPFYEYYDRLLDIFEEYDVTVSLGDACRPGSIDDSTDASQVQELIVMGELVKRAWDRDVQVIVEGPGHMGINEIAANMLLEKKLCHGAPFYVLGPVVTDVAPGYDHITAAIGGAVAAANGADFLCYVTPAEHLKLPGLLDVKEGIIAARIAAHAADIAKGVKGAREWDNRMSSARRDMDWEKMFELSIDDEKPRRYRRSSMPEKSDTCTMCGKMCAIRSMKKALGESPGNLD